MTRTTVVNIPTDCIVDWDSFHRVFQEVMGFPDFYGCNMNAWIDCMTDADDSGSGMSAITVKESDVLTLRIDQVAEFQRRCPEQYQALVESAAFVNHRRIEMGEQPLLALMLA